jgi:hypothetical protein
MKTLILTTLALAAGIALVHAQGTITISSTAATVYLNNGETNGPATGASGAYIFEVLDMTQGAWNGLSALQQNEAYNLMIDPQAISLWTDSGVSGVNSTLHAGGINSVGNAVAANWATPTGATYSTGTIDYYSILGWSANLGNWSTVSAGLENGTLFDTPEDFAFGQTTQVAYNYSGGGPDGLPSTDLWGLSGTGLAGSGGLPTIDALTLYTTPEPATLALVSLGGISMIFLRRRKV